MKSPLEIIKILSIPVLSILFGIVYLISTFSLPGIAVNYPRGLIAIIVFLSLWLIISELKTLPGKIGPNYQEINLIKGFWRPIIAQVVLLLYILTIPLIGFYLNSFLWMFVTTVIIDKNIKWRKIGYNLFICMVFIVCAYLIFKVIFLIPTPEGIWV